MTNKEHLNEKIAQIERILKWIKALNDLDRHEELMNAIWFLQHFTRDIEYICSGKSVDSGLSFWDEVDVRDKKDTELLPEDTELEVLSATKPIKWYNLTKWDKARHGDEILTFHRPDGMYASWRDAEWLTRIGHSDEYVLGDDGIYIPYSQ